MPVRLHWFLPTSTATPTPTSASATRSGAHGGADRRRGDNAREGTSATCRRSPAPPRSLGFEAALTLDFVLVRGGVVITAALTQLTRDFKYLVAFRPGLQSPTLGRPGGEPPTSGCRARSPAAERGGRRRRDRAAPLRRHDRQGLPLRPRRRVPGDRAGAVGARRRGQLLRRVVRDRGRPPARSARPGRRCTSGGSSAAALEVAAHRADVFLTWGEPARGGGGEALGASARGGRPRGPRSSDFGIRLHAITRDTAEEAWAGRRPHARRPLRGGDRQSPVDPEGSRIGRAQRRMTELHGGRTDPPRGLHPNLWAGSAWSAAAPAPPWSAPTRK